MASKRYKNQACVYCIEQRSATGDHIFAREFFMPADRDNLPQVPACKKCNNEKSQLEHYLTAVLPFGGRHAQSGKNLTEHAPKRLNKNQKLLRELQDGQMKFTLAQDCNKAEVMAIPIRDGSIEMLFYYIARGLIWHHWGTYLLPKSHIEAFATTPHGAKLFQDRLFSLRSTNRVLVNLGNGTVIYEGMQGVDAPDISVWRFHMYGGMLLTEGGDVGSTEIVAMSGPARLFRQSP